MKHGRTSAAGTGAVHALYLAVRVVRTPPSYGALCGVSYTSEAVNTGDPLKVKYAGRWHYTDEPVTCRRCLDRMERLAEQALADTAAISAMADAAVFRPRGGGQPHAIDPSKVRAWRKAWPAMSRAVSDLLRHRGVKLGDGWLGPTREPSGESGGAR